MLAKLLCLLGIHGPHWFGNGPHHRSDREEGFVRKCNVCGEKWYGAQVEINMMRTLGDWQTEKELRKNGLWRGK